jgi:hypothetical protein
MVATKPRWSTPDVKRIDGKLFYEANIGSKKNMDNEAERFRMSGHLARVIRNPHTRYNRAPWRVFVHWRE